MVSLMNYSFNKLDILKIRTIAPYNHYRCHFLVINWDIFKHFPWLKFAGDRTSKSDIGKQVYNRETKIIALAQLGQVEKEKLKHCSSSPGLGRKTFLQTNLTITPLNYNIHRSKSHTKFPSLVLTKPHTTYNQQKDQNRLWREGFQ